MHEHAGPHAVCLKVEVLDARSRQAYDHLCESPKHSNAVTRSGAVVSAGKQRVKQARSGSFTMRQTSEPSLLQNQPRKATATSSFSAPLVCAKG